MGPRALGLGATYLNFVLPTFLGSRLPAGAISASALMGAAVVGFRALLPGARSLVTGLGGLAVGAAAYVLATLLLGSEEMRELPGLLLRRSG